MSEGDALLVVQNFPPLDSEFVGKNQVPNPKALIDWFSTDFSLNRSVWFEDVFERGNNNWFIGLFSALGEV